MTEILLEIGIIFLLVIANGVLAMAEIAIVSSRRSRLQHMAEEGHAGARAALEVANQPNDFLSTVQIGITLVGILAGAFGAATLAETMKGYLNRFPTVAPFSDSLSLLAVVVPITYLSLVVGELVPKRLGLLQPEGLASRIARPMRALTRLTHPAVWLLSVSTDRLLKLFRVPPRTEPSITEEEVKILIRQGTQLGVFETAEKEIVERVFLLGDRRISSVMTPRPDIEWLDLSEPDAINRSKISNSSHSRFPAGRNRLNDFEGVIAVKDLFAASLEGKPFDLSSCLKPAIFVPESMPALKVLEHFKRGKTDFALVVDEYGGITGVITLKDVLQAIVGDLPSQEESETPSVVRRADGSWLIDGALPVGEFKNVVPARNLVDVDAHYDTVAGLVLDRLARIPAAGDFFEADGYRVEVVDMDGKRIDKVLVTPLKNN